MDKSWDWEDYPYEGGELPDGTKLPDHVAYSQGEVWVMREWGHTSTSLLQPEWLREE